ncbi:MAG: amidinotransferase [Chloroflexi bacterium]|nr:amidinotransferase [Chloroflexota bacterium]
MTQKPVPAARLLMCPPDYFGIEYEINPWMDVRHQPDHELAAQQWQGLYRALTEKMGALVELLQPMPGLPDLVFTANAGWAQGDLFIAANFRYSVRARETPHFVAWFRERGCRIVELGRTEFFEGEGDILPCGDELFAGYRFRSDIRSHLRVGEILGRRVLSLELMDARFYHLDTCFLPLGQSKGDARAAYFPGAFDEYGRKVLREYTSELIEVSEKEAERFACNAVVVGRQIVMNTGCPTLRHALEERGYTVHETPLDQFLKSGGSAKCLVLFLRP